MKKFILAAVLGVTAVTTFNTSAHATYCNPRLEFDARYTGDANDNKNVYGPQLDAYNSYQSAAASELESRLGSTQTTPIGSTRYTPNVNSPQQIATDNQRDSVQVGVRLTIPLGTEVCKAQESERAAQTRAQRIQTEIRNIESLLRMCKTDKDHPLLAGKCE